MTYWAILINLILYGVAILAGILFLACVIIYIITDPYPVVETYEEEETFQDSDTKSRIKFPNIEDPHSINLSVIVPAYNEENRLPPMLEETIDFLEKRIKEQSSYKYEIIIVSDGSTDRTVEVAEKYSQKYGSEKVRCLELVKNRGKGGAVRLGVFRSRGSLILFADADGASKFEDLKKLEVALCDTVKLSANVPTKDIAESIALIIGSRAHLEQESLAKRSFFRNILMYGFHFLVWLFTVKGIRDTQCGFKLFTRKAAQMCFKSLHVNRWAFDVELLYIAQKLHIPIAEVPVRWTEIEGSKITPVFSWLQMGCDLAVIWLKYTLGAWKIKCAKID